MPTNYFCTGAYHSRSCYDLFPHFFRIFPPVAEWYAGLKSHFKSLIMLALMLIVTVAIVLLVQYGVITSAEPITWQLAVYYFILAGCR